MKKLEPKWLSLEGPHGKLGKSFLLGYKENFTGMGHGEDRHHGKKRKKKKEKSHIWFYYKKK